MRSALALFSMLVIPATAAFGQGVSLVEPATAALGQGTSLVELISNSPAAKNFEVGRFIEQGTQTGVPYANATVMPKGAPVTLEFGTGTNALKATIQPNGLEPFLNKPLQTFYFFGLTRQYSTLQATARLEDPGMAAESAHIQIELNGKVLGDFPLIPNQATTILATIPEYSRNQNHLVVLGEVRFRQTPAGPVTLVLENPELVR